MGDLQQKNDFQVRNRDLQGFYGLHDIHNHSGWFLGVGIALIVLGFIALVATPFVTLATMVFFGALLVAAGVIQAVNAFKTRHGNSFFINLLAGIFYSVVGLLLILHPAIGAITLTLLLAVLYSVGGLFKIGTALTHRFANWGWVLFNGVISLILGIMIWAQWPASGLFIIGLFIGIDLIMTGWVWIALALSAKKVDTTPK